MTTLEQRIKELEALLGRQGEEIVALRERIARTWNEAYATFGSGHDPVTLGAGSDAILGLSGQELILGNVATQAELNIHTADDDAHHDPVVGLYDYGLESAGSDLTLTTSFQDFITKTITVPTGGATVQTIAVVQVTTTTFTDINDVYARLMVDGTQRLSAYVMFERSWDYDQIYLVWAGELTAGSKTLEVEVKKNFSRNTHQAKNSNSRLLWNIFV